MRTIAGSRTTVNGCESTPADFHRRKNASFFKKREVLGSFQRAPFGQQMDSEIVLLPEQAIAGLGVEGCPALRLAAGEVLPPRPADRTQVASPGVGQLLDGGAAVAVTGYHPGNLLVLEPDKHGVKSAVGPQFQEHGAVVMRRRAARRDFAARHAEDDFLRAARQVGE